MTRRQRKFSAIRLVDQDTCRRVELERIRRGMATIASAARALIYERLHQIELGVEPGSAGATPVTPEST